MTTRRPLRSYAGTQSGAASGSVQGSPPAPLRTPADDEARPHRSLTGAEVAALPGDVGYALVGFIGQLGIRVDRLLEAEPLRVPPDARGSALRVVMIVDSDLPLPACWPLVEVDES